MAELVYALGLGPSPARVGSSSLPLPTREASAEARKLRRSYPQNSCEHHILARIGIWSWWKQLGACAMKMEHIPAVFVCTVRFESARLRKEDWCTSTPAAVVSLRV